MPSFPERESSILAVLKKKKPGRVPEAETQENSSPQPSPISHQNNHANSHSHVRNHHYMLEIEHYSIIIFKFITV